MEITKWEDGVREAPLGTNRKRMQETQQAEGVICEEVL